MHKATFTNHDYQLPKLVYPNWLESSIWFDFFMTAIELIINSVVSSLVEDWKILLSLTVGRGFYVGVSSLEENATIEECCTFRGSFVKLDARTGRILWKTFTLPDNHGQRGDYSGGALWGSSASIDASRNHVYIATGNLYSAPQRIQDCQERLNNQTTPTNPDECIEPDNHSDSIMALDMDNGKIRWYRPLGGYDVWFFACNNLSTPNCPSGPNPDADCGEEPMMLSIELNATKRDVVAAVQKSGFAWALDRDDGNIIWFTVGSSRCTRRRHCIWILSEY